MLPSDDWDSFFCSETPPTLAGSRPPLAGPTVVVTLCMGVEDAVGTSGGGWGETIGLSGSGIRRGGPANTFLQRWHLAWSYPVRPQLEQTARKPLMSFGGGSFLESPASAATPLGVSPATESCCCCC
uniref:(northern house mosquito) hypothetical protein n=1 Tax=Culex pipiens TaxID=7175 RepID=A0A8D8FKQ5_CULPI